MRWVITCLVWAIAGIASVLYLISNLSEKYGVCAIAAEPTTAQTKTVEFLNGMIELGLTLSTGLIALSAALLLGIQGPVKVTRGVLNVLCLSVFFLCQSVLYGFLWKFRVSKLWFNECWQKLDSTALQSVYTAHYVMLFSGILFFSLLVVWVALNRMQTAQDGVWLDEKN